MMGVYNLCESVCTNGDFVRRNVMCHLFSQIELSANSVRAELQRDEMLPHKPASGRWGREPCTFPSGRWTNGVGLWKFISGGPLSRGISPPPHSFFSLDFCQVSEGSRGAGGMDEQKEVPARECYCFRRCRWHGSWPPRKDLLSLRPTHCRKARHLHGAHLLPVNVIFFCFNPLVLYKLYNNSHSTIT